MRTNPSRRALAAAVGAVSLLAAIASPAAGGTDDQADAIEQAARDAMEQHDLRAIVVRVTVDGKDVYTGALGESLTGVPATPDMHFRNGAMAFTYIGETFAQLVDENKVRLDDTLSQYVPELPQADRITIRNLLDMTSGYADYVYEPEVLDATSLEPFRQWTSDELIDIGTSAPMVFEPGTNWAYSHTNYVILGKVLEQITGKPLAEVLEQYVIAPLGLENTSSNDDTPAVPEPALHSFSSERREAMQVPPEIAFTEDSTFWNPSWTTATGAVQTTDITDMATSIEIVGNGKLVSRKTHEAQTGNHLVGFGSADPTGACPACAQVTEDRGYGLGVILLGPWITQTKNFAGNGATAGYLPSKKVTIAVATTYLPEAFDESGAYQNASAAVFSEIANVIVPKNAPPS